MERAGLPQSRLNLCEATMAANLNTLWQFCTRVFGEPGGEVRTPRIVAFLLILFMVVSDILIVITTSIWPISWILKFKVRPLTENPIRIVPVFGSPSHSASGDRGRGRRPRASP